MSSAVSLEKWFETLDVGETFRTTDADARSLTLKTFFVEGWHVLEPTTPLVTNWHIDAICEHIQVALDDWIAHKIDPSYEQRIKDLLINVPPGSAKSRILSVYTPAWMWTKWPEWRAIFFSANPRVSLRDSVYCRDVIHSEWYQDTFRPDWKLCEDVNAKGLYKNTRGGFRQAQGITARVTGDRADFLGVDDPHDAKEVMSDVSCQEVCDRWDYAVRNRVNDPKSSVRMAIMQRLRQNDFSGHILSKEKWEHLLIPQEYDPTRAHTTSIGWSDPRTEPGQLMFKERFPEEVLEQERRTLGPYGYSGQHQQSPAPDDGGRFKKEDFRYWSFCDEDLIQLHHNRADNLYTIVDLRECTFFATQDVANSLKRMADYTVICTWAVTRQGDLVLLDCIRDRLEDPKAIDAVVNLFERWRMQGYPISYIATEENGPGLPRIQHLQHRGIPSKGIRVDTDKVVRSTTACIRMQAHKIFWPDPDETPWLHDWETEFLMFPVGAHDDQVDATSIAAIEVFGAASYLRPGVTVEVDKPALLDKMGSTGKSPDRQQAANQPRPQQTPTTASLRPSAMNPRTARRQFNR